VDAGGDRYEAQIAGRFFLLVDAPPLLLGRSTRLRPVEVGDDAGAPARASRPWAGPPPLGLDLLRREVGEEACSSAT